MTRLLLNSISKFVVTLALLAMLTSLFAPGAFASAKEIYKACQVGESLDGFSKADLEDALKNAPADVLQYGQCGTQIRAALVNKATKNIPGGGKDLRSTRSKLKRAKVKELTTKAERKRIAAAVRRQTKLNPSKPLSSSSDPAIATAPGQTLSSAAAPNAPTALLIGVLGLALLAGADLAGRVRGR